MFKLKKDLILYSLAIACILNFSFFNSCVHAENNAIKEEKINKSIEKRKEFGLDSNYSKVKGYVENNNYSSEFGFYMDSNEETKLKERIKHEKEDIPYIKSYIKNNKVLNDSFVDLYIDQTKSGTITILVKPGKIKDKKVILNELTPKFPSSVIEIKELEYSEIELSNLASDLKNKTTELNSYNINLISIKPDLIK